MAITTYRIITDLILDRHYQGIPSDDAQITPRHVANLLAMEVAYLATKSAFTNSNAGEATFANDQFISVFNNLTLLTDSVTNEKYVTLPATPAGLPNNQEISSVAFTACPNYKLWPVKQKDTAAQAYLYTPPFIRFYRVENGRIVFVDLPNIVTGNVSLKMIGAISGVTLLDSVLNIPKDMESELMDRVLLKLNPARNSVPRDVINDAQPLPA